MGKLFYVGAPPLCSLLSAEALEAVERHAGRTEYDPQDLVYARGDTDPTLVIIREGEVEIGNFDLSGGFVATSRLGGGHCFGEGAMLSGIPRVFSARATMKTVANHIHRTTFDALVAESPEVGAAVTRVLAERFQTLLGFVEDMRSQPLNVQLAKTLLSIAKSQESDSSVSPGLDELATMLGVSPVALTGVVARFEREGLVRRRNGAIDVPEREALSRWVTSRTARSPLPDAAPTGASGGFAARRGVPRATSG